MSDNDSRYGAYAPPPDEYETFDAREEEQERRGGLFLAASAVVFLLFVAVIYNTFQLGVRERGQSPVITADAEPYRVAPDDPGGYQAPDQDLSAYALREGDPNPEDTLSAPARAVSEEPVTPERDMPALQVETASADQLNAPDAASARSDDSSPPSQDLAPEPVRSSPEVQAQPQPQSEPASTPQASQPVEAEPAIAQPSIVEGAYVAQIGAFRSQADAESGWLAFTGRFSDLIVGRAPDIQRADLGDRGVFHRLRVAAFATRQDAADFCAALDARGQACLVARR